MARKFIELHTSMFAVGTSEMIARMSSSGGGMGPPEMWPTMSGRTATTMSRPATRLDPDRDTPPECILTVMPRWWAHST
ncbi:hypothetical protein [Mycobacterium dioxanotrophicus]|uniref:hypothetical protein n=1 Tax=Mycobacterium dioxanotrophicus TaxID=482462 RepID=UPI001E32FF95|nr:hypothetical protein [Mycobacterium dioxanotrophicus]